MSRRRAPRPARIAPATRAPAAPAGTTRLAVAIAAGIIVTSGVLAYSGNVDAPLVFDDRPAIVENVSIRSLGDAFSPPETSPLSGRPVANLTFALNTQIGSRPAAYRATNIGIHLLTALVLFALLRTMLGLGGPERPARERLLLPLAISTLWVVHPLTTGAVQYVVQRVESLMTLFLLLTLYLAARGDASRRRSWWWTAAVACCAAGMATKEVMAVAPVLVWLWMIVLKGAPWNPFRDRRRLPLYVGLACTWLVLIGLITSGTEATAALRSAWSGARSFGWTPSTYLWTQCEVIVHYLRLVVWPVPLVIDYYGWAPVTNPLHVLPELLLLSALGAATILALVRRHPLGFAGAVFFLVLAPTSSVVPIPTEIAAEHRMYLPSAAVLAVLVTLLWAGVQRVRLPGRAATGLRIAAGLGVAVAVFALGFATRTRTADYASEETLWRDVIAKRPDNARARINYGIQLMTTGRFGEAESQMREAMPLRADDETRAQVFVQLGASLCAQGRCAEGIQHLETALTLHPEIDDAHAVLGQAFSERGDMRRALHHLRRAVVQHPDNAVLLSRTAWLLATVEDPSLRDPRAAVDLAERAVRLTAESDLGALQSLAAAYAAAGRYQDARATAARAARR